MKMGGVKVGGASRTPFILRLATGLVSHQCTSVHNVKLCICSIAAQLTTVLRTKSYNMYIGI